MDNKIKAFECYEANFIALASRNFFENQNYQIFNKDFSDLLKIQDRLYRSFKENLISCKDFYNFRTVILDFILDIFDLKMTF
jgi:hypothetical protein